MTWMNWFTSSQEGIVRGPIYCPDDSYVIGGEAWEQGGYGVVDIRLQFRNQKTNDTGWTTWLCGNDQTVLRGPITVPFDHYVAGMAVDEQAGYGVIDLWFTYREKSSVSHAVFTSDKFTYNPAASAHHGPESAPPGNFINGIKVREQAGYGIVDIQLHYSPF